jgi:hypothetical protein
MRKKEAAATYSPPHPQALHSAAYLSLQFDLAALTKVSGIYLPVFLSFLNLHPNREPKHPAGCEFDCTVLSTNLLLRDLDVNPMSNPPPTRKIRMSFPCLEPHT